MAAWHQIDTATQDDLLTWFNVDPDAHEKRLLAKLYSDGRFYSYDCGHCGIRVRHGEPDDWRKFQGVCQDEGMGQLCSDCYSLYEKLRELAG